MSMDRRHLEDNERTMKRGNVHDRLGLRGDAVKMGSNRNGERITKQSVHDRLGPRPKPSYHSKRSSVPNTINKLGTDQRNDNFSSNHRTRDGKENDLRKHSGDSTLPAGRSEVTYADVASEIAEAPEEPGIDIGHCNFPSSFWTQSTSNVLNIRQSRRGDEADDDVCERNALRNSNALPDRSNDHRFSEHGTNRRAKLLENGMPVNDSLDERARRRDRYERGRECRRGRYGESRGRHGGHRARDRDRSRSPVRAENNTQEWPRGSGRHRYDYNSDDSRPSVNYYQSNGPRMRSPGIDSDHSYLDEQSMGEENQVDDNFEVNGRREDRNLDPIESVDLLQLSRVFLDGSKTGSNGHFDRYNQGIPFRSKDAEHNSSRSDYIAVSDEEENYSDEHFSSSIKRHPDNRAIGNADHAMTPLPEGVQIKRIEDVLPYLVVIVMECKNYTSMELILNKLKEARTDVKGADLLEVLKRRSDVFVLTDECQRDKSEAGIQDLKNVFVSVQPKLKLCKSSKCKEDCGSLHFCKFYLQGCCRETLCRFGHDFASRNNLKVLKDHLLDQLDVESVRTLLQQSEASQIVPAVCKFYNTKGSCRKGDDCPFLHLCDFFTKGECKFGESRCKRSHDLTSGQPATLLKKLWFNPRSDAQKVLEQLKRNEIHFPTIGQNSRNESRAKGVNPSYKMNISGIQEPAVKLPETEGEENEFPKTDVSIIMGPSSESNPVDKQRHDKPPSDQVPTTTRHDWLLQTIGKMQSETRLKVKSTVPQSGEGHVTAGANFIPLDTSKDPMPLPMEKE